MRAILKVIHARVGFGSGTETTPVFDCLHVQCDRKNWGWRRPGNDAVVSLSVFCGWVHQYVQYDAHQLETKLLVWDLPLQFGGK